MPTRTPKLQTRSQYNPHWGVYASEAALPNGSGAALLAADFTLEAGDVAYVTGSGLYVCASPGTVGGADAVWVAAGGSGSNLLWEWNGADTTQFSASESYQRFGGGGPQGTPALSVVAAPIGGGNVLRVAATALIGGVYWPIAGLVLPESYVIEAGWVRATTYITGNPNIVMFASTGPVRAASFDFSFNNNQQYLGAIRSGIYVSFPTLGASLSASAANFNRGVSVKLFVTRQAGANPATWRVGAPAAFGMGAAAMWDGARSSLEDRAATDNGDWDGVDMPLCGPGVYVGGGGPEDISVDMSYLRILAA
jgi:hypothetical protein